jgi:hypothetical protein
MNLSRKEWAEITAVLDGSIPVVLISPNGRFVEDLDQTESGVTSAPALGDTRIIATLYSTGQHLEASLASPACSRQYLVRIPLVAVNL